MKAARMTTKDIPIIFSGPMVRALLDGRKTMTRRIVTAQNCAFGSISAGKMTKLFWEHADWIRAWPDRGFPNADGVCDSGYLHVPCHDADNEGPPECPLCFERGWAGTSHRLYPKAQPDTRLWVRESMCELDFDHRPPRYAYMADTKPGRDDARKQYGYKWRPAIHMPRAASRLTLIVTGVKIERLQDISREDAIAEGLVPEPDPQIEQFYRWPAPFDKGMWLSPPAAFRWLWNEIHGRESWDVNPEVVALTFTVHKQNIDTLPKAEAA